MKHSTKFILASGSPRRKQLLEEAGFDFEIKTIPFDESYPTSMPSAEVAEFLAIGKNKAHRQILKEEIVLTADTVVVLGDDILGKPGDRAEAIKTIARLSGNVHKVITGVCISSSAKQISFSCTTEVKFKELSKSEIAYYVDRYSPMDKAGSYAIQEWIGLIGIEWIKGSYYNVVGLPVDQVYKALGSF